MKKAITAGMKALIKIVVLAGLSGGFALARQTMPEFPKLTGPYFGQRPAGYLPEVFLPGIISGNGMPKHSPLSFSPDGTEAYWSVSPFAVYFMKLENNVWTKPEIAPFTKGRQCSSPVFSPDGKRIYFSSQTVDPEGKIPPSEKDFHNKKKLFVWIWFVERVGGGWGTPQPVDSVINDGQTDYQISLTKDGTMYFSSRREGGKGGSDIYFSKFANGKYEKPVNAGDLINTDGDDMRVFVSPDETYMLFVRSSLEAIRIVGRHLDFYISFRRPDGSWTKAEEFGDLMGEKSSSSWINVSPDGKYVFYTSLYPGRMTNIYWSDFSLFELLKPKDLK